VSLYLDRCQVDTPDELVAATWAHVKELRQEVNRVVDFGAGDGRFAKYGFFSEYLGYEIDPARIMGSVLPKNASLFNRCAFSDEISDADLCIGNPPFVRNQDLPEGWRQRVSDVLRRRTGVAISGLANAWQYFFLLSLASLKDDGLCALVIPYEWVSRPSVRSLREYIRENNWNVSVYRLVDTTFSSVLTTSSITIVDKATREGRWCYYEETASREYRPLPSPCDSDQGVLGYMKRSEIGKSTPYAMRGLSPGTQKVLTLSEGERVRNGLAIGRDVVSCVTTLRFLPSNVKVLNSDTFDNYYRSTGEKCWLVRTDTPPSRDLLAYFNSVPESFYQTSTCLNRDVWWKFSMPNSPQLLMATGFKGAFPKYVRNEISACAVGGVCGVYNINDTFLDDFVAALDETDIGDKIVAHANGLRKVEINQLNKVLNDIFYELVAENA
jgi:hypothetical protein